MKSFDYTIKDAHGIHARPATDLFKLTKNFGSAVKVAKGDKRFSFDGPDEEEEMNAVKEFMEANL